MTARSEAAEKLREQAERCRRLARQIVDRQVVATLLQLAEEFERRSAELERSLKARDSK